ncbi:ribosomal protein S3 [Culex quinquefasciatus]|uniref:40S ribosomal protein S3 n=1 Tax=Culex quinquefasciatus TaxID=7176 RepID=B0X1S2_CULQU|nr:ribosomal protein S3 [Culex quinquefasciatus]|eukprot:XP_001863594.1 ribosomal protein S3 [Culex quinquefasciatus]
MATCPNLRLVSTLELEERCSGFHGGSSSSTLLRISPFGNATNSEENGPPSSVYHSIAEKIGRSIEPFFAWPAAADDFLSVEVHVTSIRTEIIIMTTRTQKVLGEKGHHIRELTAIVQKLIRDLRRACLESGAKGSEVVVSGKLRGQRAKSMKFVDGMVIHSRDPCNEYSDTATRHILLRQGGKIMLPWDPNGKIDPKEPLPENVLVVEPKDEIMHNTPGTKNNRRRWSWEPVEPSRWLNPSLVKLGGGFTSLSVQDNESRIRAKVELLLHVCFLNGFC